MRNIKNLAIMLAALFGAMQLASADVSIEQLVKQASITEGKVAISELPQWQGANKILIRDIGMDLDPYIADLTDVEVVVFRTVPEALEHAADADAIIGSCDADLISAAKQLNWVQIYWAGAERCLVVEKISTGEVVMTNMQKMSSPVIAEHAIAMMFALARNLPEFTQQMGLKNWANQPDIVAEMTPIAGKKLLVAGLGGIGMEVARLGAALGMQVSGTRNSSRNAPEFVQYVGLAHELQDLAAEADVIVNALPLTESTTRLFDSEFFAAAKPGAMFINVGRGSTVVTDDLLAALQSGQISSAGLDVTDPEPLPADNPLWDRSDVIITPHVAGRGGERERHGVLLIENLRRYIAGEKLLNVVDPAKGY